MYTPSMSAPVNPPGGNRRYDATNRRLAAERTLERILASAETTFLGRGYAASTMARIAAGAGVAVDTVYAVGGSKPMLFRSLIERAISGADGALAPDQRDYVIEMRAEPDPARKLARYARAIREIQARLAPLFLVLREASRAEPALGELWAEIAERRAANMRLLVADLMAASPLRPGLSIEDAADILWATNSPEFYVLLVYERGWEPDRFEAWLVELWVGSLLPD
ncbi:MAG: hypothetical protein AVDCRST_MAG33-365 [uncultured Thermomicrobiales bacterium]|uniref:HTH tetR-type domain-containing protein n=1 Tax=uncultured Thermomicrobiales bacterium TaxID=1645740 RepID=A0A6J4UA28_9BACT|nr:MAG: hypothetical protein AVDCRST_MAG33-365 [uncultured Thermomicrobiales bacterium]